MGRRKRRRSEPAVHLTSEQRLLVALDEVFKKTTDAEIRSTAGSLLRFFQRTGEWTPKQRDLVRRLIAGFRQTGVLCDTRRASRATFWLYAIRIGAQLKVGYTSSVPSRLNSYRTGSTDVELMAQTRLGECSKQIAKAAERHLHEALRRHLVEREVFELSALEDFRRWRPRSRWGIADNSAGGVPSASGPPSGTVLWSPQFEGDVPWTA